MIGKRVGGRGVATPPALTKKVVEVSGPQIVGAFVGSVCRDVAYADLLAGGAGLEEEHTLPYAVVAGAIVVEHANVKIYDG